MTGDNSGSTIRRCAAVLRSLSSGRERITDLVNDLGYTKSTVYRLLSNLEAVGMVVQEPTTKRYFLGPLVLHLAANPLRAHQALITASLNDMARLRQITQETVVLHVRMGLDRICISELESPQSIKYTAGIGSVSPIYTGSAGKMLLSEMEPGEFSVVIENLFIAPVGPNTVKDKNALLKEIEQVKRQGFAVSLGERLPFAFSLSAAIRNHTCPVALSVLGPENRFRPQMKQALAALKRSAEAVSGRLIPSGPDSPRFLQEPNDGRPHGRGHAEGRSDPLSGQTG